MNASSGFICEIRLNWVPKGCVICYAFYIDSSKVVFFFFRILVHLAFYIDASSH